MLVAMQGSRYKQASDAAIHHSIGRPAVHDGKPFPLGIAVLLLPSRRSGSGKSSTAPDRSPHPLRLYSRQVEGLLQRCGKAIDRPRTAVAHAAGWLSVRCHERKETGGRAAHASGVALVHRTGLRLGDSTSLHVFQEPAWSIPGIESVSGDL